MIAQVSDHESGESNPGRNEEQSVANEVLPVQGQNALTFLMQVKEEFKENPEVYTEFLDIMKDFKAEMLGTPEVVDRVHQLFVGRPHLLYGFQAFLPPTGTPSSDEEGEEGSGSAVGSPTPTASEGASASDGGVSRDGYGVAKHGLDFDEGEEYDTSDDEHARAHVGGDVRALDHALEFVNMIKVRYAEKEGNVYQNFLFLLDAYRKGKRGVEVVFAEINFMFKDSPDLMKQFKYFLPEIQQESNVDQYLAVGPDSATSPHRQYSLAGDVSPVGSQDDGVYRQKYVRDCDDIEINFNSDFYLTNQLQRDEFDELMEKWCSQLEDEQQAKLLANLAVQFTEASISWLQFEQVAIQQFGIPEEDLKSFSEFVQTNSKQVMKEQQRNEAPVLRSQRGMDGRGAHDRRQRANAVGIQLTKAQVEQDRFANTPISELNLNDQPQATPSYRQLPSTYPAMRASGRNKLPPAIRACLNDQWVSQCAGSEDFSFARMRKNQYEEALFKIEDERYEMEMGLETNSAVMRVLLPLINKLDAMDTESRQSFTMPPNVLKGTHQGHLKRLYGNQAQLLLEQLEKCPGVVLPPLYKRLKSKQAEWAQQLKEAEVTWGQVSDENFGKSLDHRSFYFRQQDKRTLASKGQVEEARQRAEQGRQCVDQLKKLSSKYSLEDFLDKEPSVTLSYSQGDRQIHDHIVDILKYSLAAFGNNALEHQTVMQAWLLVFEPFMGLPHREMPSDSSTECETDAENAPTPRDGAVVESGEAMDVSNDDNTSTPQQTVAATDDTTTQQAPPVVENTVNPPEHEKPTAPPQTTGPTAVCESRDLGTGQGQEFGNLDSVQPEAEQDDGEGDGDGEEEDEGEGEGDGDDVDVDDEEDGEEGVDVAEDGDDGEEGDEDDEDELGNYDTCFEPVYTDNWEGKKSEFEYQFRCGQEGTGKGGRQFAPVMYCSENMYIVLRLHHILFERLCAARRCCEDVVHQNIDQARKRAQEQAALNNSTPASQHQAVDASQDAAGNGGTAPPPGANGGATEIAGDIKDQQEDVQEQIQDLWAQFMQLVRNMIKKRVAMHVFEDQCRELLGNNAYILFTLDKLLERFTKKLSAVVLTEPDKHLLALYRYEHYRRQGRIRDDVYFANACANFDSASMVYRIVFNDEQQELDVFPVDLLRSWSDAAGSKLSKREEFRIKQKSDDFLYGDLDMNYKSIKELEEMPSEGQFGRQWYRRPFLFRNLPKAARGEQCEFNLDGKFEEALSEQLGRVIVDHDLQLCVDVINHPQKDQSVFKFEPFTEDLLISKSFKYVPHTGSQQAQNSSKRKFSETLDERDSKRQRNDSYEYVTKLFESANTNPF